MRWFSSKKKEPRSTREMWQVVRIEGGEMAVIFEGMFTTHEVAEYAGSLTTIARNFGLRRMYGAKKA